MLTMNPIVEATPYSKLRVVFNKVENRPELTKFTLGEPNFDTAPHIIEAACKAMRDGHTHYVHNAGVMELREAIAEKLQRENGLTYDPKTEIMVGNGGTDTIYLTMQAILAEGDEVIVPGPYWTPYPLLANLCHAKPVIVPMLEEDGFMYNLENLRKAVNSRTKLLILNSPCNPTGGMAGLELLKGIAELAQKYDFWVISDEVYEKLVFDGNRHYSIAALPGMKERTIVANSFSKSYAMTGWRVGYIACVNRLIANTIKLHELQASCTNVPAQYGAIAALRGDQSVIEDMVRQYARRRKMLVEGLNSIRGISCVPPKGTFYAFVNIQQANMDTDVFCDRLIDEAELVVIPGNAFGEYGEGYIRMSFAVSDETIVTGLEKLEGFMKKLPL